MTPELLTELKRLEREATPAGWRVAGENRDNVIQTEHITRDVWHVAFCPHAGEKDAQLIVAMRNSLPTLLEAVETMHAALKDSCKCEFGEEAVSNWKVRMVVTNECAACRALARVAGLLGEGRGK